MFYRCPEGMKEQRAKTTQKERGEDGLRLPRLLVPRVLPW